MGGQNTSADIFNYEMLGISLMRDSDEPKLPESEEKIPETAAPIVDKNKDDLPF